MKARYKLLSISLLSSLLFQGCASYQPTRPTHYPPPAPTPAPAQTQPSQQQRPMPADRPQVPATASLASDLSRQAAAQAGQGKLDLAAATLERGLRMTPKDAELWSQLAEIKLQQRQYRQAGSLAAKSFSLSGGNSGLKQKNYWIIEQARRGSAGY